MAGSRKLCELLLDLFGVDELRRHLLDFVDERNHDLVHELPGENASPKAVAEVVEALLERHGYVGPEFFSALRQLRPRQKNVIREFESVYERSAKNLRKRWSIAFFTKWSIVKYPVLVVVAVCLVCGVVAAMMLPDQTQSRKTPKIYISNWVGYSPLYIAQLDGKLESWELLDSQHKSRFDRRETISNCEVEFFGGQLGEFIIDIAQQSTLSCEPTLLLVIAQQNGGDAIVSRNANLSLADLKNEKIKIGGWAAGTSHYLLLYRLAKENIAPREINFVHVDSAPELVQRFAAGEFDVIVTWSPWAEIAVKRGGHIMARGGGAHGPPETFAGISASDPTFVEEYEEELKELFEAWNYGLNQLRVDETREAERIAPWLGLSKEETVDVLKRVNLFTVEESLGSSGYSELIEKCRTEAKEAGLSRSGEPPNLTIDVNPAMSFAYESKSQGENQHEK